MPGQVRVQVRKGGQTKPLASIDLRDPKGRPLPY